MASMWAGKQFEEWDEFVDEVVSVDGRELRIAKRNLERQVYVHSICVQYTRADVVRYQLVCVYAGWRLGRPHVLR